MSLEPRPGTWGPIDEPLHVLQKNWLWFLLLGIALLVFGILATQATFLAGEFVTVFLGCLLLFGGGVEIASAVLAGRWRGFFAHLLIGILYFISGVFIVEQPVSALAALTLLLGVSFLVGGIFRIVVALGQRFRNWGWVLVNGVIMVVLGVMIWRRWPFDTFWVVGLLVGIEMIFNGVTWIAFSLAVRSATPPKP
jgi:uncharacterized membrane protein HdeD (DUF308 family)